ncbi:NACHT domain-containing protein [Xanthobacter versatilis]|uniref:NACHT domain-containing protein n=1 Tax=Xanthobacter autotrophicus (strain ATCC BAA-1158 / Py2) TaxID=78245 RepID=UPI0037281D96
MPPLKLSPNDLAPFADLGTSVEVEGASFRLTRNGSRIQIEQHDPGYAVTTSDGTVQRHLSAGAVLADTVFADLPRIARNQVILLAPQRIGGRPVPVSSKMNLIVGSGPALLSDGVPWNALSLWLSAQQKSQSVEGTDLLLIDGPAGVGKTTIVREAALLRAENYDGSVPLILQIASRGRVLQNISDLIAFALQDVRSNLTVSQLISLMRHGLIVLAIDGFDELSDPNGFETAWSGLNSIINSARGAATFLLAGRETFVSTEIIRRQLKSFDTNRDRLASLSIGDPDPVAARDWLLLQEGWDNELLSREFVEPIFVEDSYALRPFFLGVIAREPVALTSNQPPASDLLSYLVDVMTEREAQKFVEILDPPNGRESARKYEDYVGRYLEELARDLAENQSEAIAEDALDLLATVAADGLLPDDQVASVVQRARTVVFLANDQRAGHVRFAHEQLLQHFLSREALRSVGEGETPRYVRRNLFGREALEVFGHVARGREEEAARFLSAVRTNIAKPSRDRTNTNLAVLGVAAACATAPENANLRIQGVGINELHFPFAAPCGITIRDTTISVLHAASADLRNVTFEDGVYIATLEIDRRTRLSASMPSPQILVHPSGTTADPREIGDILAPWDGMKAKGGLDWPEGLAELLGRIDRYRTFWLRTNIDDADPQGRRIISHPDWPAVYEALRNLDLVTVKSRQASGVGSEFLHFRQNVILLECVDLYKVLTGAL